MPTYLGNDKYNATLSQGYTIGDTTLYVSAVPTNVPTIITLSKGTANECTFTVTGKTTNSLTGVAYLKGASVNLPINTTVTIVNNTEYWNQYATAIASAEGLSDLIFAPDGGSTDDYAISLSVAPTSYVAILGVPIVFKANTSNTGASTLNINGLGAKTIKKNYNADLDTGDITANQLVTVVYDGTNFQIQSHLEYIPTIITDGWNSAGETWTYASATTITVPTGAVSRYAIGDKIKWTQTTVKYGVIIAVADTLLTIATNTNYTVANAAITSPYFSHEVSPLGYPAIFNYTPVFSGTIGDGTLTGRFRLEGKTCLANVSFQMGSTTSFAGGNNNLTMPIASANLPTKFTGAVYVLDNGTAEYQMLVMVLASASTFSFIYNAVGGGWTSAIPMTWATNDKLEFSVTYPI
jgi:hypothetical protein